MRVDEQEIENSIKRIGVYLEKSDKNMRMVALLCANVVGKYSSVTQNIADRYQRHVSTVENWAHAGQLLLELIKENRTRRRAVALWKSLSISHWSRAWEIQNAGYRGFYYLNMAAGNRLSGRDMTENFKTERESGIAPMLFDRGMTALVNLAFELSKEPEYTTLPENKQKILDMIREELSE